MDNSKFPSEAFFRKVSEENFKTIMDSLSEMILAILLWILLLKVKFRLKEYKYSDLTFMILKDYLEKKQR
jgi:hypothetical protein